MAENTQGERKGKKKINQLTNVEALEEMKRLERSGHQTCRYYLQIRERARATSGLR